MSMRCALYFGSFNPLHKGHVAIARYVMENCDVDSVRLVLSPQSPFKDDSVLEDADTRLAELNKSITRFNNEYRKGRGLEVCTVEFNLPRPNYTYNTLQHLKELEPDTTFSIVMGADNLASLERWYKGKEILQEFEVMVYPRTGFDTKALCQKYGATYLDAPLNDISSTMIRNGEKNGLDMSHLRY